MRHCLRLLVLPAIAVCLFACSKKSEVKVKPVPVIFDTDVGNDIDDVQALQMLLNYEQQGLIDVLGITISKANPRVIEYIDGYCNMNGRTNIPLGYVYDGPNPEKGNYVHETLDTLIDGQKILHPQRSLRDSLTESYKLLRKLLASQEDTSVVLIAVGPETNISRLLSSEADEYSPLNGTALVAKKVKLLSVMGGLFDNSETFPEWNIVQDTAASRHVFAQWPTRIVASGWETGNKLLYPHQSILHDFKDADKHPLCVSYKIYQKMPYDRQTWDLTSVLYAIEPDSAYFTVSPSGNIVVDSTGKTIFTAGAGKHHYLQIDKNQTERTLNALVQRVTGK